MQNTWYSIYMGKLYGNDNDEMFGNRMLLKLVWKMVKVQKGEFHFWYFSHWPYEYKTLNSCHTECFAWPCNSLWWVLMNFVLIDHTSLMPYKLHRSHIHTQCNVYTLEAHNNYYTIAIAKMYTYIHTDRQTYGYSR